MIGRAKTLPNQKSKSTLLKPEGESAFERMRLARMPDSLRHKYIEFKNAQKRLAKTTKNLAHLKKEFVMQEKIWAQKRKNPDYSELDAEQDNTIRNNYLNAIKAHEEAITTQTADLKIAKENWIKAKKANPGFY